MLFNSHEFIFVFLPVTLLVYFYLGRKADYHFANAWLVFVSLFFYSYWNIKYLPLLLCSIGINYYLSGKIIFYRKNADGLLTGKLFFVFGMIFNAALLGLYKYADFLIGNVNFIMGMEYNLLHIVLPLGISFFTITQMVYLVDCYEGIAKKCNLINYALFVSFFPHLLAGPILYHKSMMKQFADKSLQSVNWENVACGLALFIIGLSKKMLIADSLSNFVGIGYGNTENLTLVNSWLLSICYMMQLFFDFSGYSDMAVGISRMFNIQIPVNFKSPYRAYGMINFWSSWHISLTTTITNYLYTPMVKLCKNITFAKAMWATLAAMFIAGIWHGAGWTFVIFGTIHGLGLVINHIWKHYHLWMWRPLGYMLTLLTVLVGTVFFRADSVADALNVLCAMSGGKGIVVPTAVDAYLSKYLGIDIASGYVLENVPKKVLLIAMTLVIFAPSSNELIEKMQPDVKWAVGLVALFITCFLLLGQPTEFLYFQF